MRNQDKINHIFDNLTTKFGVNRAGVVHTSLLRGEITPKVRSDVRKLVARSPSKMH